MRLMFGGTDNHLLLIDVTPLGLSGGQAEKLLDSVGITLNKNMIPDDPRKPMDPSGIRFGSPSVTTSGFKEKQCMQVAELMIETLKHKDDKKKKKEIREEVRKLCKKFPIPEKFF